MKIVPLLLLCVLAACASTDKTEVARQAYERDIAAIIAEPVDETAYGKTKRCLSSAEYRDFRPLDDRHILFEGRRGRYWLNALRMRCIGLRHAQVLITKPTSSMGRLCDLDTFYAADWFDRPWYRRWPWRWGAGFGSASPCTLGQFQPVTEAQVLMLENAIKRR